MKFSYHFIHLFFELLFIYLFKPCTLLWEYCKTNYLTFLRSKISSIFHFKYSRLSKVHSRALQSTFFSHLLLRDLLSWLREWAQVRSYGSREEKKKITNIQNREKVQTLFFCLASEIFSMLLKPCREYFSVRNFYRPNLQFYFRPAEQQT